MGSTGIFYSLAKSVAQTLDFTSERARPYNTDGADISYGRNEQKLKVFHDLIRKPAFTINDVPACIDAIKHMDSVGIDDRQLLLEKLIVLMSRLQHLGISAMLQKRLMTLLYNDIPSPPTSFLSFLGGSAPVYPPPRRPYIFRSADGSHYNPVFPSLGCAGTPYARSVPGTTSLSNRVLPDPYLIFNTLLRRKEFTPHPGGISSLFFAFANLIIHDLFDTNREDWTINNSSSYLDLSILYGNSENDQNQVRRKDGTGRLWDDVFADSRLILMPPACGALLVLLSRNHNYIAQKLLAINENHTFLYPPPVDGDTRIAQDDEIFHRARLVNCGFFVQIILRDYVGAILGLVRDGSDWRLDPLVSIRNVDHRIVPRGQGNSVSIEFNLLYRWHSALSVQDTLWTEELFKNILKKEPDEITTSDFRRVITQLRPDPNVRKRTFGGLARNQSGAFNDEDLARIIHNAIEQRAGAFKAHGIPDVLRVVELLGIEQSRTWGACSLNEFRKFMGLKPYSTFSEWNPDPRVHNAAEVLYEDIDNLELYVGLQAEDTKVPGPGAGLCPGYTISRAILGDAVMLTRGDRYLTTEFTPSNLTTWGFNDCKYDPLDGSYGGMLTKLLFRTLPDHFPSGSTYAHFPFLVPAYMKDNLLTNHLKSANCYTWTRPFQQASTIIIDKYSEITRILNNPAVKTPYDDRISRILQVPRMFGSKLNGGRSVVEKLLSDSNSFTTWSSYFQKKVEALILTKSGQFVGAKSRHVDIVGDVINLLPVHWISEEIIGLPLKTTSNTSGIWYEQHLYRKFADVGHYIFMNSHPGREWQLLEASQKTYDDVSKYLTGHINAINSAFGFVSDGINHLAIASHNSHSFIKTAGIAIPAASANDLCAYIFASVIPTSALYSRAITHVVDFYLDEDKRAERMEISRLFSLSDSEKILSYVYKALRLSPITSGIYLTALADIELDQVRVLAGGSIFADISAANVDSNDFDPDVAVAGYDRHPADVIFPFINGLLSSPFFNSTAPTIIGTILSFKNMSRFPGPSGQLSRFTEYDRGRLVQSFLDSRDQDTPFPLSLVVQYDI